MNNSSGAKSNTAASLAQEQLPHGSSASLSEPVIGWIAGHRASEGLVVDFEGNPLGPQLARSVLPLSAAQSSEAAAERREALLCFNRGDPAQPIIVGLLQPTIATPHLDLVLQRSEDEDSEAPSDDSSPQLQATLDRQRLVLEGQEEVVLRCGEASITLRSNGRVVVRGVYVESHATGTNRIKGGAVRIN